MLYIRSLKDWAKRFSLLRKLQPHPRLWFRSPGDLPKVMIIGAQKSGTTFLHNCLVQSPNIEGSPLQQEVHYFDNKYYRPEKWYRRFFNDHSENVLNIDTSPYYMFHPAVPERVYETLPSVKVIAVLRNPIDRAYSHYWHEVDLKRESRSFRNAVLSDIDRVSKETCKNYLSQFYSKYYFDAEHIHHTYVRRGLYSVQLKRWGKYFPEKILVVKSSDLFLEAQTVIDRLADYLGLAKWKLNYQVDRNKGQYKNKMRSDTREMLASVFKSYNQELSKMTFGKVDFQSDMDGDANRESVNTPIRLTDVTINANLQ